MPEENIIENKTEIIEIINNNPPKNKDQKQIASAIVVAGILIAGAILLKSSNIANKPEDNTSNGIPVTTTTLAPVNAKDRVLGNPKAKVTLIMYEDFQCPFCGAVTGLIPDSDAIKYLKQKIDPNWAPFMPYINEHIKSGDIQFVYRDYPFLGPESVQSAIAARCAGDQGKFWEYHDYLYSHQNGENKGSFSDSNLKSFAKILNLDATSFDKCLDEGKYAQAVTDSKNEGTNAGVTGTPRGFILRDGKISGMIDGAEPLSMVQPKIEKALK